MVAGKSFGERAFNVTNVMIMCILMFLTLYPFWYAVIGSLDSAQDLQTGPVFLWPRVFTWASYREVLNDPGLLQAVWVTASRTVIVTVVSITYTALFAYAYSRRYLKGKKWYTAIGFISMYFGGGLIPTFMLYNWLGLYDNYLVYIIPSLFGGFWNVIILNANYKSIPDSLFEAAKMDGASELRIFFQIVMPLSKPVLAALSVFTAVGVWNDYGTTLFFTQSSSLQTLQYLVLKLIQTTAASEELNSNLNPAVAEILAKVQGQGLISSQTVELAAMVLAAIPVIVMYPFAQRYFIKGVLIGSVKE
ncbi:sugar ABC transporter permease [Alicyclobacillus cellulosilyticus]|uniref:Sugar ABC transporter permease n=1 Tax=Alicyclobacillus cellulosilyticus TaxID=1003997 RepID=A0A917KHT3_9BACL|nr:carbohydrate ABC transporter permease [Alicyclobacillus cellulosilyticus]GGJ11904.1 sugar ABC transporter permease [Alicyclobacillus cellulosilyticus]